MKKVYFFIAIFLSCFINYKVFHNQYSFSLYLLWILSLVCICLFSFSGCRIKIKRLNKWVKQNLFLLGLALFPVIIRTLNFSPNRIHQDDLITAYFSTHHDFSQINLFGGIPQNKAEWVAQFPTTFFILQKIFFLLAGESILSVKLSILPYVFIISLMLFLIVKEMLNKKTAIISVFLYAYLAISMYLETLGLHFVSSTAAFMVFFYLSILNWKNNNILYSVLSGITCGFCFLFYLTSYIAFPMLNIFFLLILFKWKRVSVLKNYIFSLIGFLIVLSPYLTYALKYNNYFTSRIAQVSLFTGSWSEERKRIQQGENPLLVLSDNLSKSVKSFYQKDIGGHGGYTFAHLALLEKISLSLFLLGLLIGIMLLKKKVEIITVYLTILFSFFTVILATPPPAFQRFSLAFPFLAIIFSFPFYFLFSLQKSNIYLKTILATILLAAYMISNQSYFFKSVKKESNHPFLSAASFINQNFPRRNIYVASFPGYAFEKIFYFSEGKSAVKIITDYHDNLLKKFNLNEKYFYLIIFPEDFNEKFLNLDKNGRIINFSKDFSFFVN